MNKRPNAKLRKAASSRTLAYIYVPRSGLILLIISCLLVVAVVAAITVQSRAGRSVASAASSLTNFKCASGPWGQLDCSQIMVEMPDEAVTDNYLSPVPLKWYFRGYTTASLADLFASAGLAPDQFRPMLDSATADPNGPGSVVSPSDELMLSMPPQTRVAIDAALSKDQRNTRQVEPYRFLAAHVDDWFRKSGLPQPTEDLIRRLMYRRGDLMLFSALDVVLGTMNDRAEKVRLIRTLSRSVGLLMNLRVDSTSNVDELARYWGPHGRDKELRPLLESLARSTEGGSIGSAQLLPPFARARVYTYPLEGDWGKQTCYWTAMNFFNAVPDNSFEDMPSVAHALSSHYVEIVDWAKPQFGDLILLMKSPTEAVHACNYVADGVVFTKNGPGRSSPWMLMKLDDVLTIYSDQGRPTVHAFRMESK